MAAQRHYLSVILLLLFFLGNCYSSSSEKLWLSFKQATGYQKNTVEDVTVQFLRRFICFSSCQDLSSRDCLSSEQFATLGKLQLNSKESLKNLSSILVDHVLQGGPQCEESASSVCKELEQQCAVHYLAANEPDGLELMLLELKKQYHPQYHEKCFESSDLHQDAHIDDEQQHDVAPNAEDLVLALFIRLYNGECFRSNSKVDFVGSIFNKYNDNNVTNSLSEEGLEELMKDLGILRHNDGHDHDDHDHDDHGHSDTKSNVQQTAAPKRTKRELENKVEPDPHHDHGHMPNSSDNCWSSRQLFTFFDENDSGGINEIEFLQLCPALVQQRLRGSCMEKQEVDERSTLEVYGYGTLAVFLISFCSVLGVVLMPIQNSSMYQYVMICFIALAFGTLTGDALLHLIPEAVGLHTHDDSGGHSHADEGLPDFFWKFFVILGSVYGLFVFEGIADLAVHGIHKKNEKGSSHGHSHIPSIDLVQMTRKDIKTVSNETLDSTVSGPAGMNGDVSALDHRQSVVSQGTSSTKMCCGMTTLALVIIIGDAIHNVADGLTIGAAFSSSNKGGMSSALAIFFHELPHEFGDFVILLSSGFSFKKALIWNFAASLTAFIGLYVGIGVGENEAARQWILTVAAGMFLYIAVGNMLPELKNQKADNGLISFIVQNVGVLIGMTCMILMSVFEDKIKV